MHAYTRQSAQTRKHARLSELDWGVCVRVGRLCAYKCPTRRPRRAQTHACHGPSRECTPHTREMHSPRIQKPLTSRYHPSARRMLTASAAVASASDAASLSASPTATPSMASAYKRKRFNSSAEDLVELLSPALQPTASKHSRHAISHPPPPLPSSSASSSTAAAAAAAEAAAVESVRRAVYIQLAAESPHRSDVESEDSMYGSFHACETGELEESTPAGGGWGGGVRGMPNTPKGMLSVLCVRVRLL